MTDDFSELEDARTLEIHLEEVEGGQIRITYRATGPGSGRDALSVEGSDEIDARNLYTVRSVLRKIREEIWPLVAVEETRVSVTVEKLGGGFLTRFFRKKSRSPEAAWSEFFISSVRQGGLI